MKWIEQTKYLIHRNFRLNYGVHLTQAQLDDIHDFYHEIRKQAIFNVGMYRVINAVLAMIITVVWWLVSDHVWFLGGSWFFLIVATVFIIYNIIHAGINYVQFKRIKTPKRPSDD